MVSRPQKLQRIFKNEYRSIRDKSVFNKVLEVIIKL